jgi:PhnB protein
MSQINAFLRFNDRKCREAMNFYKQCFGGELTFMTLGESPMAKDMPNDADKIIHSSLKNGDIVLFGSDMVRDKVVVGDNVVLAYNCKSENEINDLFRKLSEGGEVFMPLAEAFWGALFGVVTDRYGFEWMLNFPKK